MKYYEIRIPWLKAHSLLVDEQDSNGLLEGNYTSCHFPVVYLIEHNTINYSVRSMPDLLCLIDTGELLISNKLMKLINDLNATGWKTYNIELYYSNENYISGYFGFSIVNGSMKEPFDFVLEHKNGSYHYYCSNRIKQIIEKYKFKGIIFKDSNRDDTK